MTRFTSGGGESDWTCEGEESGETQFFASHATFFLDDDPSTWAHQNFTQLSVVGANNLSPSFVGGPSPGARTCVGELTESGGKMRANCVCGYSSVKRLTSGK